MLISSWLHLPTVQARGNCLTEDAVWQSRQKSGQLGPQEPKPRPHDRVLACARRYHVAASESKPDASRKRLRNNSVTSSIRGES
jgi:hypothetical protein